MICSICNRRLACEDTHTIVIANGIDERKYIFNRFYLCPDCYSDFKYRLEVTGTPIEGPEDRDDIKTAFPEIFEELLKATTTVK